MADEQQNQDQDEGFPWPDLLRSFGVDADNDVEHFFEGAVSFDAAPPDTDAFQVQLSDQTLEFERRHAERSRASSVAGGESGFAGDNDKHSEVMANEKDTRDTMSAQNEGQLPADSDDQSSTSDVTEKTVDELGWEMPSAKPASPRPARSERKPPAAQPKRQTTPEPEAERPATQPTASLGGWDEIVSSLGVEDRKAGTERPEKDATHREANVASDPVSDADPDTLAFDPVDEADDEPEFDSPSEPTAERGRRRRRRRGRRGRGERPERDDSRGASAEDSEAAPVEEETMEAQQESHDEWDGFGAGLLSDQKTARPPAQREYAPVENFVAEEGQGSVDDSDEDDDDDEETGLVTWTDDDANEYVSFEVEELDPHGRNGRSRGRGRSERQRRGRRDDDAEPRKDDPAPARETERVEARDSRSDRDVRDGHDDEDERPRRRSRRRRGSGRGDSERNDDGRRDRPARRSEPKPEPVSRRAPDDEGDDDEGDSRDTRDRKPRNLPTWNETIDVIVQSNLAQRKRSPGSGGSGGRRRRGSGRGGRR